MPRFDLFQRNVYYGLSFISGENCYYDNKSLDGKCYFISRTTEKFDDAKTACAAKKGMLAKIEEESTLDMLKWVSVDVLNMKYNQCILEYCYKGSLYPLSSAVATSTKGS